MDIHAVRQALADAVNTIAEVNCFAYVPDNFVPPAFVVGEVDINFHQSYGELTELLVTCTIYVSASTDRSGQLSLDNYLARTGSSSIKAAIEATRNPGVSALSGTADDVAVTRVTGYRRYSSGETSQRTYYGAEFTVRVIG